MKKVLWSEDSRCICKCLSVYFFIFQSYPTVYVEDVKEMWDAMRKVDGSWENVKAKEVEETKKLWEKTFDQPYEKAGGGLAMEFDCGVASIKFKSPMIYWKVSDSDVNTKYKSMVPRFLLEASSIFVFFSSLFSCIRSRNERSFYFSWLPKAFQLVAFKLYF